MKPHAPNSDAVILNSHLVTSIGITNNFLFESAVCIYIYMHTNRYCIIYIFIYLLYIKMSIKIYVYTCKYIYKNLPKELPSGRIGSRIKKKEGNNNNDNSNNNNKNKIIKKKIIK